jgi:hypothetical protein
MDVCGRSCCVVDLRGGGDIASESPHELRGPFRGDTAEAIRQGFGFKSGREASAADLPAIREVIAEAVSQRNVGNCRLDRSLPADRLGSSAEGPHERSAGFQPSVRTGAPGGRRARRSNTLRDRHPARPGRYFTGGALPQFA